MVYQRYIYKRGKRYGPYYYQSKRFGKRTTSVYVGTQYRGEAGEHRDEKVTALFNQPTRSTLALGLLGLALVLAGIFLFFGVSSPSGRVTLNLDEQLVAGEPLRGTLSLTLQPGELIPSDTQLNRHTLIAGGTGCGKTVAAMDIVEEVLKKGVSVVVLDPVGQWSGFAKKCDDERMRKLYKKFGMGLPRSYEPRVFTISAATMNLDVVHYLKKPGLTILRLDKLTPKSVDQFIEGALQQVYREQWSESGNMRALLVLDEVHRLLPKYGGRKAYVRLEQAVREFRKWGIGLLMISQVLTDFKGAIRGNIGTEIQMRTRYEGDIKRVRERHGADVSKLIARLSTGLGMLESADYNKGNPYFVEFRPLLHSPWKLSNEESKKSAARETPVLRMEVVAGAQETGEGKGEKKKKK